MLSSTAGGSQAFRRWEYSLQRMGTLFRIALCSADENVASRAAQEAFERVEQLEQSMSDYREDSEIRRLCREAVWNPTAVSHDLFLVLDRARFVSRLTGGAFDITVGPVVALWREARRTGRPPDPQALERTRDSVGYEYIELDPLRHTVLLTRYGMQLDLGGIAKGFAADAALQVLNARGIHRAMIDAGGDLVLGDPPPGEHGWRIALPNPDSHGPGPDRLVLSRIGVATSGDAYQHLDADGRRYSHIVNPANGTGITDSISTTVLAPDGVTADALATGLSILPAADALKVADSLPRVSVMLMRRVGGEVKRFTSRQFPILLSSAAPR